MNWQEAQHIYLPSVNTTVGKSWFRLRKLWERYKKNNRIGESNTDVAYQINQYQHALDLPRTPFEELVGIVSDHEFEGQNSELHPEEWSALDQQLLREEQMSETETEAEMDDWWISDD